MSEKKVGKRLLTWVLVLVMTLSLLPLNVLAAETASSDVKIGHYNENGNWTEGAPIQDLPMGVDSVSKTAVPVGDPKDNTYQVTLEVKMHTTTTTETSYAQAATVLVIDTSGSMSYCLLPEHEHTASCYTSTGKQCHLAHPFGGDVYTHDIIGKTCILDATTGLYYKADLNCPLTDHTHKTGCGKGNDRLATAKTAAIDFLDSYRAGGTGRYVALVHFSTGADVVAEWQDVSNKQGYDAILTAISNLKADGGTNLEQGLDKAQGLLGNNAVANIASKNIIALTDGKPTYYNAPESHSEPDRFGNYYYPDGDGKNCDTETFKTTKGKADEIHAKRYSLYSICFGAANEEVTNPDTNTNISLFNYLNTYIAPGKTYSAGDFTGLKNAFDAISKDITTGLSSGTVHDSLPVGVTSAAIPNRPVDWDLSTFHKETSTNGPEGNTTTTYTYTKSYTVTIDPTNEAVAGKDYYPLNGRTTLTVKNSNNEDVTIDFPIPAGKVTVPTHKVEYKWTNAPEGEQLPTGTTVTHNGPYTVDNSYTNSSKVEVKDAYGNVTGVYTFGGWDKTGTITITEDTVISGTWSYTEETVPTHKVEYKWTNAPEGVKLPTGTTVTHNAPYTVDNSYTNSSKVEVKDAYGNVTGVYTFGGWDKTGTITITEDTVISGTWSYTEETVPTHKVEYKWTNAPEGVKLPTGTTVTHNAPYTVDNSYTNSSKVEVKDAYGNVTGVYTFGGWDKTGTITITEDTVISGTWSYTEETVPTHKVEYKWTNAPEGVKLPTGTTVTHNAPYTVDNSYTNSSKVEVKDAYGNVKGVYTFGGWNQTGDITITADTVITGTWSYEEVTVPTHKVEYTWTNAPEGVTLPTGTTVTHSAPYTVDSTYSNSSTVEVKDAYGNVKGVYTFGGWNKTGTITITEDTVITGAWSYEKKYTVKYDLDGGTTTSKETTFPDLTYGVDTPTIATPTKAGYTFAGWNPEVAKTVTKDVTYNAKWNTNYVPYYPPVPPTVKIEDDDALGLNTTDHFAYIVGYGNGEVRPQNNITRAEVATIFFRLLTDDVRDENLTKTNRYSDVASTSWYNTAVSTLSSMGIITGYPDGTFRPNAAITRAEFAAIAARFDNDGDKTAAKFSDIATHWAKDEISIAYNNGWITGYPDGTFGPQRDITRAETMTLVNRVLNRQPETEDDLLPNMTVWTDNANPKAWYYLAVQEATNSHYYKFKTNSKYEKWTELRETRDWTQLEK